MMTLFYQPLCPFSRKIRLMLAEEKIAVQGIEEYPWMPSIDFESLLPTGELPTLLVKRENENGLIAGQYALSQWVQDQDEAGRFLPENELERAEARRLVAWFDEKFYPEAVLPIRGEKIEKRIISGQHMPPDTSIIRAAVTNMKIHFQYMDYILSQRSWLAGEKMTIADLTAAAHISCLDYTGDVSWSQQPELREWYARIKSRPAFRPLLKERLQSIHPVPYYMDLDF